MMKPCASAPGQGRCAAGRRVVMKRRNWRLTWCGAWTWAALAAPPAAAQSPQPGPSMAQPVADAVTAVQLAWMADPSLFPYALTARAGAKGLVLSGYVPNER